MRVYIPLDWSDLPALVRDRGLSAPVTAYAVTEDLRRAVGSDDEEEIEECARTLAADAALLSGCRRPCVLAVEVEPGDVDLSEGGEAVGEVIVRARVRLDRADAVLVSPDHPATRASAESMVNSDDELELLWFAPQEIEGLLADG